MKVLMFGWEFPPFNAGGLGTACHGLTKALVNSNVEVTFVLPKVIGDLNRDSTHVNLLVADDLFLKENLKSSFKYKFIDSMLTEYIDTSSYDKKIIDVKKLIDKYKELAFKSKNCSGSVYGKNLFEEVYRFSEKAGLISEIEDHDIIHAHDWMTYDAGIKAKKVSGKPLVVHIHATEFDRTADHPNQYIYDIERRGFHAADRIVAVSHITKERLVEHYGVAPEKITVVHNGVEFSDDIDKKNVKSSYVNSNMDNEVVNSSMDEDISLNGSKSAQTDFEKTVLFLGRLTIQKGPEYFLAAAKKVLDVDPTVKFVVAGNGDMEGYMIHQAAEMGISKNVLFTGFLRGKEVDEAYKMADLYVMPSISEPFGITPLEAMRNNTPCIISKNSGVSEVLNHCLKVDFWDIDMTSNMILAALNYDSLYHSLQKNGMGEAESCNWEKSAAKCISVYRNVLDEFYN